MRAIDCLLFVCLLGAGACRVQTVGGRLRLQVGGSAGSPEVARYIRDGVAPTLRKYGHLLDVEYVPWGKTRRVAGGLECEFGASDCWANRLHRCALDALAGDGPAAAAYLQCEFGADRPGLAGSYECALRAGLRAVEVDGCMATAKGDALEAAAEAAAAEPIRAFERIPYTVINGAVDPSVHEQAAARLESLVCFALADDPSTGVAACRV